MNNLLDIAEIRDKHLITNFKTGNVYLNYQGAYGK
jgi:hypothetical protein